MNYRTLALIGLRLLAIWLIVLGISYLPQLGNASFWFTGFYASGQNLSRNLAVHNVVMVGMILTVGVPILLGLLLWAVTPWLARLLAPSNEAAPPTAGTPMLIQGAIGIAGLVIAVTTLPSLIYTLANVLYKVSLSHQYAVPGSYTARIPLNLWLTLAIRVILLLLGLVMVVGSRRLRVWIYKLRTVNT
ncbi:MAG: hypothetical protein L0I62_09110 [Gammaproteobacteria bacterium]|nr:hypothetical protein [Gammaproteobacteria bacterium]